MFLLDGIFFSYINCFIVDFQLSNVTFIGEREEFEEAGYEVLTAESGKKGQ
jgi:hypothetical protein